MRTNLSSFSALIFLLSFTEQTTAQQDDCPPWFIPDNTSITGYSCHHQYTDAKFYCSPDYLNLHFGYCMTYNDTSGVTAYGPCPYIGTTATWLSIPSTFSCQVMCLDLMSTCVVH